MTLDAFLVVARQIDDLTRRKNHCNEPRHRSEAARLGDERFALCVFAALALGVSSNDILPAVRVVLALEEEDRWPRTSA